MSETKMVIGSEIPREDSPHPGRSDLHVLLASLFDPNDFHSSSGAEHALYRYMKEEFQHLAIAWPLQRRPWRFGQVWNRLMRGRAKHFLPDLVMGNARHLSNQVNGYAAKNQPDAIFCLHNLVVPEGASAPSVLYMDAPLCMMLNYYEKWSNIFEGSARAAMELEKQALSRCARVFYASDWACDGAAKAYGLPRDLFVTLPRGPSLARVDSWEDLEPWVKKRLGPEVSVLFVGVQWERKGGDVAANAVRMMRDRGVNAYLDIVGVTPPEEFSRLPYVRCHGFLRKSDPAGAARLSEMYRKAALFMLPTRAEAMGISFCEASAYAVPTLGRNTGGVGSAVKDGLNGALLAVDAGPDEYAARALAMIEDEARYFELCHSSYEYYETRMAWEVGVKTIRAALAEASRK